MGLWFDRSCNRPPAGRPQFKASTLPFDQFQRLLGNSKANQEHVRGPMEVKRKKSVCSNLHVTHGPYLKPRSPHLFLVNPCIRNTSLQNQWGFSGSPLSPSSRVARDWSVERRKVLLQRLFLQLGFPQHCTQQALDVLPKPGPSHLVERTTCGNHGVGSACPRYTQNNVTHIHQL